MSRSVAAASLVAAGFLLTTEVAIEVAAETEHMILKCLLVVRIRRFWVRVELNSVKFSEKLRFSRIFICFFLVMLSSSSVKRPLCCLNLLSQFTVSSCAMYR